MGFHQILSSIKGENLEQYFVYEKEKYQFNSQNLNKRVEKYCDLYFSSAKQKRMLEKKFNLEQTGTIKSEID